MAAIMISIFDYVNTNYHLGKDVFRVLNTLI